MTRAREQVVLVTSIPVAEVSDWLGARRAPDKPRDYLQAYLDYAAKVSAGDLDAVRGSQDRLGAERARSGRNGGSADGFVCSVESFVRELGHEPVRNADEDDAFGLDFAIEDRRTGHFGIGIECDAPRHPLLQRARAREIWRPKVLGRAIPKVHRVASAAWYARGTEERVRLKAAIEAALSGGHP